MSAETMGTIVQSVLIVGAVVCAGFVLAVTGAALCIVYLFARTVYRAVTGQPLFPDEPERDLSDVMLSDYGDVPFVLELAPPRTSSLDEVRYPEWVKSRLRAEG